MAGLLDNLQEMARGIHPAIVAPGGGLESALKALARRCTVPVELDVRGVARLPGRRRSPPATWSRKMLTNAAKHAHASVVHVDVEAADYVLGLRVRDDGSGGPIQPGAPV